MWTFSDCVMLVGVAMNLPPPPPYRRTLASCLERSGSAVPLMENTKTWALDSRIRLRNVFGFWIQELCCLHLASLNWSDLPSKILRASHVSAPSRRQLQASQVCEQGKEIQDYLMVLLNTAKVLWWKLPPVLLATASIYRCGICFQISIIFFHPVVF